MSKQNSSSNHCSRTYWTPTMERYFIDLMLEHIQRGNRSGHTFNKQAWTDMLAVFNAKFGSQYDKDVLKARYTSLWRLFNDIKNLLSQNGFSWDATRQMVLADDSVWNTYITAHPEAKAYRTKSVLNFDDLCLIYGYTVADGRYSRSSHDVDVEDETLGMNFGDCNSSLTPCSSSKIEWTPDMDQYFIEMMLRQQERGNKLNNTFTKQAWTDMLTLFCSKFSSTYNKRILRHRFKKLCKYYSDLMILARQRGFRWDETREMVVADDDVWDAYIKAHPKARSYRAKVFPRFNNLRLILGDIVSKESQSDRHEDKDTNHEAAFFKAGSERSRTYWTPPMDCFLINLMLEQVRRGNRIGQSFITVAWNDMAKSFNENFNSSHDREVLKNRYKHFRKQYNDVRILLQHGGFSWDEGREMVTAKDHVWEAYIKAHPDARSYRIKAVPCYPKLCIIYGQDVFDGSQNHLIDNITPAIEMKIGNSNDEESVVGSDLVMEWTPSMEHYLIAVMLEQVHLGNKTIDGFDEQAWARMTLSFKEKFGAQYEQHILENRYLNLMKQYMEISNLLNQEGFLWDEASQMIIADDNTWESYIKEHQEAFPYKDRVLGHYIELCAIFGTNESADKELSCDLDIEFDENLGDIQINEYAGDLQVTVLEADEICNDQMKKRPPPSPLTIGQRHNKAQKTEKEKLQEDFASNISSIVTKWVEKETENNYGAIEKAIEALQAIPGMDDEILLDGCDLLEDERKAKTFLALDVSLRKKWLLRKLGRT